ncbi:MAG TPA: hypothetical protein VGE93_02570, partial [Bryobacteraceae bacterium]
VNSWSGFRLSDHPHANLLHTFGKTAVRITRYPSVVVLRSVDRGEWVEADAAETIAQVFLVGAVGVE